MHFDQLSYTDQSLICYLVWIVYLESDVKLSYENFAKINTVH